MKDDRHVDSDASAIGTATNGDQSHAPVRNHAVLQLLNTAPKFSALRLHPDAEESSCTDHVVDTIKVADGGKGHDEHDLSEASVDKISTSESNPHEINKDIGHSSSDSFTYDSTSSPQTAKIRAKDRNNNSTNASPGKLLAASSTGSNANKNDSPNSYDNKEEIKITGSLASLPAHVQHYSDVTDELTHFSNAGIGMEGAIEALSSTDGDRLSFIPSSLNSYTCADGQTSKKNSSIVTLGSTNEESPPTPLCIHFADHAITEKIYENDSKSGSMSQQSASSEIQPPVAVKSNYANECQVSFNEDSAQQSRAPQVNRHYGLLPLSPPVIQRDYDLPRAYTDVLSQSWPNQRVNEEEFKEDVLVIPDAFIVEANTPRELHDVEFAELVEPDRSTFSFKKRHACVISIFFAAIVVALGVTVYFRKFKPPSTTLAETPVIFSPSLQPTFLPPSTQPSSIQPSSQPSLSIKYAIEKNVLQRNVTFDVMDVTDPRALALNWINRKDKMMLVASDENFFQRYILALLAFELSNLGWISDVMSDGSECNWLGVVCDQDGHVIKLMLDDSGLDGTMPPEIGSLGYLQILTMSGNSLSETLPYELGNLRNMSELYLDGNKFTGSLPSEIGNLERLTALDLSGNDLTGTLPLELGALNKLTKLSFESNQIAGTLPTELGNLIALTALMLSGNQFSGTLPPDLGHLSKLIEVDLRNNQLRGILPSELGNLSNLTQLKLSYNAFTGPLPSELGNLKMLSILETTKNTFTGSLPSELGHVNKLTELRLDMNEFTGNLPSELGNLNMMTDLMISVNGFNGTLPTEIGNLEELFTISCNGNVFSGTLPTELGRLKKLDTFYLFSNKFDGSIPSELGHLTSLTSFSIYSNQFTGTLPSWIGDYTQLRELDVSGNGFAGTLPSELGVLKGLTLFRIDKNEFTGTLPSWIGDFKDLSLLWVNNNQFTGTFPSEIENNLDLASFCLSSNNFTGPLPAEIQVSQDCQY
ncbi:hypothetical protein HJC23_010045 [Cyclotella cryptica]|uniref:Disease resistance R13L4/SHOC-2-like LRR domain-containing protein n=1 Tax=Cyclotella cryptica TaxID=29204 RepID=A0ABD3NZ34_9STRA